MLVVLAFASAQTEIDHPTVDGILDVFALYRGVSCCTTLAGEYHRSN